MLNIQIRILREKKKKLIFNFNTYDLQNIVEVQEKYMSLLFRGIKNKFEIPAAIKVFTSLSTYQFVTLQYYQNDLYNRIFPHIC